MTEPIAVLPALAGHVPHTGEADLDIHTAQHKRIIMLAASALTFGYFVIWYLFTVITSKGSLLQWHETPVENYLLSCAVLMMCGVVVLLFRALEDHRRIMVAERYDHETGLPNGVYLKLQLEKLARKGKLGNSGGLLAIGIDGLVSINVAHGYSLGNQVIRAVSDNLKDTLGRDTLLVRMTGDTFAVFVQDVDSQAAIKHIAQGIFAVAEQPVSVGGVTTFVSFSIGAVLTTDTGTRVDEFIRQAELSLLHARTEPNTNIAIFSSQLAQSSQRLGTLETGLREALESGQIQIHYQPLIDGSSHSLIGVEALARWTHPVLGPIPPCEFVPLAESLGLNEKLGNVVLRRACNEIGPIDGLFLAVNISPNQLLHRAFTDDIDHILATTGFDPSRLEVEITENVFMSLPERVRSVVRQLRSRGISVALDDFGTGFSGLSYLKDFELDRIKVDAAFTRELGTSKKAQDMFASIVELVELSGARITVEGIEQPYQLAFLERYSDFWYQGYLFSRPVSYVELLRSDLLRQMGTQQKPPTTRPRLVAATSG